tara:strand:+ start:949 stop:1332 length:384 start_codon:yes stop_codon:yes gene_type:complete
MAAPNIVSVSSIYGKTTGVLLNTTTTTGILTCASNKVLKVNSIICANVDGSASADVTINFFDTDSDGSGTDRTNPIASTVPIPADSTLVVLGKDSSIYLEEGDKITGGASANGDIQCTVSYEELDDA